MRSVKRMTSGAVLLLVAGCGTHAKKSGPEPVPVEVQMVSTQPVQQSASYSGEIRPDKEVVLAFREPGYVAALLQVRGVDGRLRDVQVGDAVPAGTVLAHLRRSDYEASFESARGQRTAMQGGLAAAEAELDRAKADQLKAEQDFDRAKALYAAQAMTRPDYDAAVAQQAAAAANLQAALRQIDARRGQLTAALGQATTAQISLMDTQLTAPMPAVLVGKSVEPGSLVAAGTPAFTLDDTRIVKVTFGVPDSMLSHLRLGQELPVTVDALPGGTYTGRITQIAASADRNSRIFSVEVSLPNRDRLLKVGMIAKLQVQLGEPQNEPVVPMAALMTTQSGSSTYSIFTVQEQAGKPCAYLKSVRVGQTLGKSVVIEEGLLPGERIIVNRTNQLNDGTPIRVVE